MTAFSLPVFLAFLAFLALGLPDGLLGVAWPSLRTQLGLPLDSLALLLAAGLAGYILSSFGTGYLLARMRLGALLSASTFLAAAGLAGFAVSPGMPALLLSALSAGLAGGAVDAALNSWAAVRFRPRTLNLLHACYSLGGLLGTLILSAVLARGLSWRLGYAVAASAQAGLGLVFLLSRRAWETAGAGAQARTAAAAQSGSAGAPASGDRSATAGYGETLRVPAAWLGGLAFFLYTGMEFSVGQWAYTLLLEGRGLAPETASAGVAAFWAAFTAGRAAGGFLPLGDRVGLLLRVCPSSILAAALVLAVFRNAYAAIAGLALLGAAFAPVYPVLVAATPLRLEARHAANVMGFQVAAATAGGAALPWLVGAWAARQGAQAIAAGWVVAAAAVFLGLLSVARSLRTVH